jgi:hypothetical protein
VSQQLTDMTITRVSLVDKGANARRLAVLKRDEEGSMSEGVAAAIAKVGGDESTKAGVAGFLQKMADALLGKREPVAKTAATFAEVVAGQQLSDALWDSWYTLEDVLWGAIYAYDENAQPLSIEAKKALVAQDLDEFKAYLLVQMDATGIEKREASPAELATRHVAAIVAKAGRKISGDRLGRLQAAAEALNGVLSEVVEATEAGDDAQEDQVDKAELVGAITEAVTKAQAPLVERLEALEKRAADAPVAKGDGEAEGEDGPATLDTVVEVIGKLADRIEGIEKRRGERSSVAGQDGEGVAKRSVFAGTF